jgi:hypothetical protein
VALQYSGASAGGIASVAFQSRALGTSNVLRGRARYTARIWGGCGPVTHARTQSFRAPNFSVQGASVVVTWQPTLPNPSYCGAASASAVTQQFQGRAFTQTIPLASFTCLRMSLQLFGSATIPAAGAIGRLTWRVTVTLKRPAPAITVSG